MTTAAFGGDGKRIVTASNDNTARIWNAENGKEILLLKGHDGFFRAAFSGDGKRVVTRSRDNTAHIWDAESGKQIAALDHVASLNNAAFSADGKRVVTASKDNTAHIWDAESGKEIAVLKPAGIVGDAQELRGDGKRVQVVTSDGNVARIWDVESGKQIAALKHAASLTFVAFNDDGKRIVTASDDNTARILGRAEREGDCRPERPYQPGDYRRFQRRQ